jgi:hypothetical protein
LQSDYSVDSIAEITVATNGVAAGYGHRAGAARHLYRCQKQRGCTPIYPTNAKSTSALYNSSTGTVTISGAQLSREVTGSEDMPPRYVFTCNPYQGGGRSLAFFNAACFAPVPKGSVGIDSGWDRLRGPGYNNWEMSLFEKIQLGKEESRYLQLRLETVNTPNHTEWNTMNRNATFHTAGQIANLPAAVGGNGGRFGFGALNTVRAKSQRILQIAAKFYF